MLLLKHVLKVKVAQEKQWRMKYTEILVSWKCNLLTNIKYEGTLFVSNKVVLADILDVDRLCNLSLCIDSSESESEVRDGTSSCTLGKNQYKTGTTALTHHNSIWTFHHKYFSFTMPILSTKLNRKSG